MDVWRIEPEGGIKITHQNHLVLFGNMIQKLLQIVPNLGSIGKKLFSALESIPGMLIYDCNPEKGGSEIFGHRSGMYGNLFRSCQGATDEHQDGCVLRRRMYIIPFLRRPGGIEIPTNFLQCYDVQRLRSTPMQKFFIYQGFRCIPGHALNAWNYLRCPLLHHLLGMASIGLFEAPRHIRSKEVAFSVWRVTMLQGTKAGSFISSLDLYDTRPRDN